MIAFHVHDMTCGHCGAAITRAIQGVVPSARVEIDLVRHSVQVRIDGAADDATLREALQAAIGEAGYTPVFVSV